MKVEIDEIWIYGCFVIAIIFMISAMREWRLLRKMMKKKQIVYAPEVFEVGQNETTKLQERGIRNENF